MGIITNREQVLGIYNEAFKNGWVLPCFCSENLTTTEAVLAATKAYGEEIGTEDLPIILAITNQYDHRTQSAYYTHTRRWDIGLKLFLNDLKILTEEGSPYEKLRVMVHLDHTQFDDDAELLSWDMNDFSSIMFDASKVSFEENIKLTREFVLKQGAKIVVEGACDEIVDATGEDKSEMTTAENAKKYFEETGVDLIVANLGTEHRASAKDLKYYGDYAKKIKNIVGTRIVLHGASSVPENQIAHLIEDGVCKVNIWTALERDSSPKLLEQMVQNAIKVAGENTVKNLKEDGLLGLEALERGSASIGYFTTEYRQNIVYNEMVKIVGSYLRLWYKSINN